MRRMQWLKAGSACVAAILTAACGTVRPANVSGLCRGLGNELAAARGEQQVSEIFEGGIEAGCWTRPGRG